MCPGRAMFSGLAPPSPPLRCSEARCPKGIRPQGGVLTTFSLSPMVPHVSMWSDKIAPIGYNNGGIVEKSHINIPDGILPKGDPDKVFARLAPNELIVPVKHVKKVVKFLKSQGIRLPGT